MNTERLFPVSRVSRWVRVGLVAMAVAPAARVFGPASPGVLSVGTQAEALALWVLCLLPAWQYVSASPARRAPVPFFALFGIIFGVYYALPLALGLTDLGGFGSYLREEDYAAAADAALLGWAGILAGFALVHTLVRVPDRADAPSPRPEALMHWARLLVVGGIAFGVGMELVGARLPSVFASAVRFVQTLTTFGLATGIILSVRGLGSRRDAALFAAATALMGVTALASGSLAGIPFLVVTVGFSIWCGRGFFRPRELVVAAAILSLVVSLKAVLPDFRAETWYGTESYSLPERVVLMQRLVRDGMAQGDEGLLSEGADRLSQRSAVADLLADVIQRTPADVPYWNGESYVSLIGAFVPRILWPDKPEKNLGQDFGHRYEYIGASDTGTSINFPWLVEFYANFGMGFMLVGGGIVGSILSLLGRAVNRQGQGVFTTAAGIALLVPLYNIESDFSLIYGGLILNGVALYVVVRYIEHATRASHLAEAGARPWVPA